MDRFFGVPVVLSNRDAERSVVLASPTLLQGSGLGGPAVGQNLHVHPSYFMSGVYDEVVEGWAGQILTSVCHDFNQVEEGHGFVVEAAPMGLGFWTGLTPWHDGEQHKREQLRLKHVSGVWGFARDHGAGHIERDALMMRTSSWCVRRTIARSTGVVEAPRRDAHPVGVALDATGPVVAGEAPHARDVLEPQLLPRVLLTVVPRRQAGPETRPIGAASTTLALLDLVDVVADVRQDLTSRRRPRRRRRS